MTAQDPIAVAEAILRALCGLGTLSPKEECPMPPCPRKPGISYSPAPGMHGAILSGQPEPHATYQADQRCQAVGRKAEGEVPTIAADS